MSLPPIPPSPPSPIFKSRQSALYRRGLSGEYTSDPFFLYFPFFVHPSSSRERAFIAICPPPPLSALFARGNSGSRAEAPATPPARRLGEKSVVLIDGGGAAGVNAFVRGRGGRAKKGSASPPQKGGEIPGKSSVFFCRRRPPLPHGPIGLN